MVVHDDVHAQEPVTTEKDSADTPDTTMQVACTGDSIEVWWDGEEEWFPGIVREIKPDTNGTAWECLYDETSKKYWHNLETEKFRRIPTTMERLNRLRIKDLRARLRTDGVHYDSCARKKVLVDAVYKHLTRVPVVIANNNTAVEVAEAAAGDSVDKTVRTHSCTPMHSHIH